MGGKLGLSSLPEVPAIRLSTLIASFLGIVRPDLFPYGPAPFVAAREVAYREPQARIILRLGLCRQ